MNRLDKRNPMVYDTIVENKVKWDFWFARTFCFQRMTISVYRIIFFLEPVSQILHNLPLDLKKCVQSASWILISNLFSPGSEHTTCPRAIPRNYSCFSTESRS